MQHRYHSHSLAGGVAALVFAASSPALFANGFRLPDQDASATARGEAFVATADNPAAIYYNPAGIAQLRGHNVRAGVYGLSFTTSYDAQAGGSSESKDALHLVPQLFYTYSPEKGPLAFGLGVYAPFGLSVEWPETTGFRAVALKSDLQYLTVNPVVAWRLSEKLSIAAGPTFNFSEIELKQGLSGFPGNDSFSLKGDAQAFGFNAGLLWKVSEQVVFGAAYRSRTTMDYDGHTSMDAIVPPTALAQDARAKFPFPQSIVAGISWRPTPDWNLEFNVDWTDWERLNTVPIRQTIPVPPITLNWQSSFYYEFGVTRKLANGWHLNAGYIFNENSIPDQSFTPLVPDLDRHFLSAGVGRQSEPAILILAQSGTPGEGTRPAKGRFSGDVGRVPSPGGV